MIVKQLRFIPIRSAVVLILPFLVAGCFFNLSEQKDFSSWYYGDPGMAGALDEAQCDRYADRIQGERHRYYLHFRTPEVLLQPQGGTQYPARLTAAGRHGGNDADDPTCERAARGWETFRFDTVDAGLVDTVIPYRKATAVNDRERGFGQESLAYAGGVAYNTGLAAVMKAPIYIVHDILKTLYIPVAGTYYLFKPDEPQETPSEIIQVQDTTVPDEALPAEAAPADEPTAAEVEDTLDASTPSEDKAALFPADEVAAPTVPPEPMTAADAVAEPPAVATSDSDEAARVAASETLEAEREAPTAVEDTPPPVSGESVAAEDPAISAVEEKEMAAAPDVDPGADPSAAQAAPATRTPLDEPDTQVQAAAEKDALAPTTRAPVETQTPSVLTSEAVRTPAIGSEAEKPETAEDTFAKVQGGETAAAADETAPETPPAETGASATALLETEKADEVQPAGAEPQVAVADQTDKVGAAAATLAAIARTGTKPGVAETETEGRDVPAAETGPDKFSSAPSSAGPSGEIVEEDLLAGKVPTDGRTKADGPGTVIDRPGEAEKTPAPDEAPAPMASVTSAQKVVDAEVPQTLEPLDTVRIVKRKLHKKVAFIGFFSRATGVDDTTKAYLQDHLWPVFEGECGSNLTLLRRGDAGYPAALDSLVRDQFGRLNSFELTTVARFGGLNAIVSGTIIDIRVASALSGILWYKSQEGQLRLTILVEVFDAETGTKILDQTYIREEEVEELEPAADEALRPEDRPILEAALRSVAEDMGEQVCENLDDLPWRAYVSGINGDRVSLSAGESAGLVPGNILNVYNSQIIDGLNNQQFFLTGERVGQIQIIEVSPNRSEAILIEGQGLRDYSVAMPK